MTNNFKQENFWSNYVLLVVAFFFTSVVPTFAQGQDPIVVMQTSKGPIVLRIYLGAVPNTSRNFLELVDRGFYNGLTFHRIESWCIQGGDPTGTGTGNFVDPRTGQVRYLQLEINQSLSHSTAGVLAMARSTNPNSASCQFYITKAPMRQLDRNYAIFGHVIDGMNAVNSMGVGDRIISASISQGGNGPAPRARPAPSRSTPPPDSGF